MTTATRTDEYRIPEANWEELVAKLNVLNKKALKLDAKPIELIELGTEDEIDDQGLVWRFHRVRVTGEVPKLKGWSFIATLVHTPKGNLVLSVPGTETVPERYRTTAPVCDYCKRDWIQRRDTYLVQNEQGEYQQVGSTCLSDFLGHPDPYSVAALAQAMGEFRDSLESLQDSPRGIRTPEHASLEHYLAMTAAVIEKQGWRSRKEAYESSSTSTADAVIEQMVSRVLRPHERIRPEERHLKLAREAVAFARVEIPGDNDYRRNMKVLTAGDTFPLKTGAGTVASLVPYYKRETEQRELRRLAQQRYKDSRHIGTIGDRLYDLDLTIVSTRELSGYGPYQVTTVHKMVDDEGNLYTWFATTQALEVGREYTISGTVKAHKEYQGTKETVLTRCRVEGESP